MIHLQVHPFIQSLADGLTSFDLYYMHNRDEFLNMIYRNGYREQCNGDEEQYDNEKDFAEYPGETLFYHLLVVKDAINPQTKLPWFFQQGKHNRV